MSIDIQSVISSASVALSKQFADIEDVALYNQRKVLEAFRAEGVSARHFNFSTGYGYDDTGRDTLARVYARVFRTDSAIVSPLISGGTHALTIALFGLLRTGDHLLAVTGKPYDTLDNVISGSGIGSLADYGITYDCVPLKNGHFDEQGIRAAIKPNTRVVFATRSRGYEWRNAMSEQDIQAVVQLIRSIRTDIVIVFDNCYGEFVYKTEPTDYGADVVVGSLIKNIGGGIAVTGGYIAGRRDCIDKIGCRLTAPSVGTEVGSYFGGYLHMFEGLFIAPHVVSGAVKGALLFAECYRRLGYKTLPALDTTPGDIICSIRFDTKEELVAFCCAIQAASPVDSYVVPMPWAMPGYTDEVIMAAGTFVQGASIELSCDSPIRAPYIAYLQGGITYEHIQIAVEETMTKVLSTRK